MNIKTTDEIGFAYPKNKKWVGVDDEIKFLEKLLIRLNQGRITETKVFLENKIKQLESEK